MYKLLSVDYDFDTGRNAENGQIIIGILAPDVVVLHFSNDGVLLDVAKYPAAAENIHDLLEETKSRLEFEAGPIRIREFFLEEDEVGIQNFPDHYVDYLNHKNDEEIYDPESKESYEQLICEWERKGNFVFFWGKDYYIDGETGEIEST